MSLLTIVVPTVPGREQPLSRCLWSITQQVTPAVDVLVMPGRWPLGDKCNAAAEHITTPYMTVVDDDDYLAADYVASVVPMLHAGVDFVGLKVLQLIDGKFYGVAAVCGDRDRFDETTGLHGPSPKGITRTDIWRRVPFENEYRSDRKWMRSVAALIDTHAFVDRPLYVYDHWTSSEGWGSAREVGVWPYDPSRVRLFTR